MTNFKHTQLIIMIFMEFILHKIMMLQMEMRELSPMVHGHYLDKVLLMGHKLIIHLHFRIQQLQLPLDIQGNMLIIGL